MTERRNTFTRGARWDLHARIKNSDGTAFDLTGYTVTAEFRETESETASLIGTWGVTELDLDGEGFNHAVRLRFDASVTAAFTQSQGFWDVKVVNDADTEEVHYPPGASGQILIDPRVTA